MSSDIIAREDNKKKILVFGGAAVLIILELISFVWPSSSSAPSIEALKIERKTMPAEVRVELNPTPGFFEKYFCTGFINSSICPDRSQRHPNY